MMNILKVIKMVTISGFVAVGIMWTASNTLSKPAEPDKETTSAAVTSLNTDDFVGSESCKACHEDQFNRFAKTQHARVADAKSKMQGCESCHGSGKAHIEGGGDKTKIHTFANEGAKQISETCLTCHAGRNDHNNYRRGEHWRNDVGCTDCHSAHPAEIAEEKTGSSTFISPGSRVKPDISSVKMLKENQ